MTRPGYKKYLYFLYGFNLRTKMVSTRTKNAKGELSLLMTAEKKLTSL